MAWCNKVNAKVIHAPEQGYDRNNFQYDRNNDCYICPEHKVLPFKYLEKVKRSSGREQYVRVYQDTQICRCCPCYAKCTASKTTGRRVKRSPDQDALDIVNQRMKTRNGKRLVKERKEIIEHPFGTVKHIWGYRQFLCRTREKVTGEQSLAFLSYSLRRVFHIFKENGKEMAKMMG